MAQICSMTGYGRCQKTENGYELFIEIKSVNHRYFEFACKTPRAYNFLEDKLKALVASQIGRGKVQLNLFLQPVSGQDKQVSLNLPVAKGYLEALRQGGQELGLAPDFTIADLARMPDVFVITQPTEDDEAVWSLVQGGAQEAIEHFTQMRATEGVRLAEDILNRAEKIERLVTEIETQAPKTVKQYRDKLYQKLCQVLEEKQIDQNRILTEAAIFADKVATDEETVRLKSHIAALREIFSAGGAVGRKLDFLVQEFNREANTIGSKCTDIEISRLVVELKSEIEKIREQVQNIE